MRFHQGGPTPVGGLSSPTCCWRRGHGPARTHTHTPTQTELPTVHSLPLPNGGFFMHTSSESITCLPLRASGWLSVCVSVYVCVCVVASLTNRCERDSEVQGEALETQTSFQQRRTGGKKKKCCPVAKSRLHQNVHTPQISPQNLSTLRLAGVRVDFFFLQYCIHFFLEQQHVVVTYRQMSTDVQRTSHLALCLQPPY